MGWKVVRVIVGVLCVVETAVGIASPGLQCELYRAFCLPAILVGDGRLGGISGTISTHETLKRRGYDVVAVVFEDHGLVNESAVIVNKRETTRGYRQHCLCKDDLKGWPGRSSPSNSDELKPNCMPT